MVLYLVDPRNTTKPYNFELMWGLRRNGYPFVFIGYVPKWWGKYSPVKEVNPFLPISRGVFENKHIQYMIANITQSMEMFFGYLRFMPSLKEDDVIHFLWFTSPSIETHIVPRVSWRVGKLVHTAHNLLPHRERKDDIKLFSNLYRYMDTVIVHAEATRDEFHEMFGTNTQVIVIPHGNLENFYNTFDETDYQQSKRFYEQRLGKLTRPIFLFMGPIKRYKGFEVLIKAVDVLNQKGLQFSVVVKDKPRKVIPKLYYLAAELPYSHVGLIYRYVDVVVLPHTRISQSVTLFEAGYFSKPVIVSRVGGLPEVVRDGVDGLVFDKNDHLQLADRMERFIRQPDMIKLMGESFKSHLIENYGWDTIIDKYVRIYGLTH